MSKETFLGFNIINKNYVEQDNTDSRLSGLLSPIDLKESNREIAFKLDELVKSYETKERDYNAMPGSLMSNLLQDDDDEVNTSNCGIQPSD